MACGEAEDAGGLTPVKDDNEAARHFIRRTLLILDCGDYKLWNAFEKARLRTVGAFVYPKELEQLSEDTVIFNSEGTLIRMEKAQFFLDMDVAGHILGVLWVLSVGMALDRVNDDGEGMYEHSYGNRLKRDL